MNIRRYASLRPMEESDLEQVLSWRNAELVRAHTYTDHIISLEEHRKWYAGVQARGGTECRVFMWRDRAEGVVQFTRLDPRNGSCYWGFYLGRGDLPKGTGTLMCFLGVEYAFDRLGIRKLCGEALAGNGASRAIHGKLGFTEEGCLRRHVLKNGQYEDVVMFACFAEEWGVRKEELERRIAEQWSRNWSGPSGTRRERHA